MQLGLSENLSTLVARRFKSAKDGSHLVFSQTQLTTIQASGLSYQLRYCPALAKKAAAAPKPNESQKGPKPDPFKDPSPDLVVAQIPQDNPTHTLVLNKFPVIPNHFIIATKAWKPQTDILEEGDLEATYACLRAWEQDEDNNRQQAEGGAKRLFAFFNSGDDSGASQPHRHLQFLPVEAMRGSDSDTWEPLIDVLSSRSPSTRSDEFEYLPQLPFAHFALPLPPNPSAKTLHSIYLSLYKAAVSVAEPDAPLAEEGPSAISYNLAMTVSAMMICPRRSETARIPANADDVAEAGVLSLNGTILAGTLMVKAEAEWNELRRNQERLTDVLATIGFPRSERRELSCL